MNLIYTFKFNTIVFLTLFMSFPSFVYSDTLNFEIISEHFPPQILEILKSSDSWQTVTYQKLVIPIPNKPLEVVSVEDQKKWKLIPINGGSLQLQETTKLTIVVDIDEKVKWNYATALLSEKVDLSKFYFMGFQDKGPKTFKKLSDNRFEIISNKGNFRVVFFPTKAKSGNFEVVNSHKGVWTAPFGAKKLPMQDYFELPVYDTAYLHHDLSKRIPVYLDKSFPDSMRKAVVSALDKWNSIFGFNIFDVQPTKVKINLSDCFSTKRLCIKWEGPEEVAWTNFGGQAVSSFDPQTGLIIGGLVILKNSAPVNLEDAPQDDVKRLLDNDIDLSWATSTYLKKQEFENYRHPLPNLLIEHILLHEIGHFNGLTHNFAGSTLGSIDSLPSESIMDYIAFPVAHNFVQIGSLDKELIDMVYRNQELSEDFIHCSDSDILEGKIASCNNYDVGDPSLWYISMAKENPEGVFGADPGYVSLGKDGQILSFLGKILGKDGRAPMDQKERVNKFLCSQDDELMPRINEFLIDKYDIFLKCDD